MLSKKILSLTFLLPLFLLANCTDPYGNPQSVLNKESIGAVLGGAAGAWAGSSIGKGRGNIVATGVGAVLGGLIGQQLGRNLDDRDRMLAHQTTQQTLESRPSHQPVQWHNPDNGHHGEIVARPSYRNESQQDCREYTNTVFIDGQAETLHGTACRDYNGQWNAVQS